MYILFYDGFKVGILGLLQLSSNQHCELGESSVIQQQVSVLFSQFVTSAEFYRHVFAACVYLERCDSCLIVLVK